MYKSFAPPPDAVTTIVVHKTDWHDKLKAVSSLNAVNGVTLSADLPGVVDKIHFESGKPVKAGEVLVELQTAQEKAQLQAAQAKRDFAYLTLNRAKTLLQKQTNSQAEFDTAQANFNEADADVALAQASISRKTIRAPFDGQLGIRKINLGQYLNPGEPIVSLESLDPLYVNFSLPQQNFSDVKLGDKIEVTSDATSSQLTFEGTVTAIDPLVDPFTRNFQLQGTIPNSDQKLRPGMFVNVEVVLPTLEHLLTVPATAIKYAPYGDSVFVISQLKDKDGKAFTGVQQMFVKLGAHHGDLVSVVSGLNDGVEVVTSGVFKLKNNGPVSVDNSLVKPGNDINPNPPES